MIAPFVRVTAISAAYLIAAAWVFRAIEAATKLPHLPNLLLPEWDSEPAASPSVCVIVPARNEEQSIERTLVSLLNQNYARLSIVAVNDRSEDSTGAIIDKLAADSNGRLRAVHISDLPDGWLGKTHAMHVAASSTEADYLLFTDADIVFEASILRRALMYAESCGAGHVVVAPNPDVHSAGEGALLGFLQALGIWASRPWRVADPKAKRDFVGVGAFNLIRRDAFQTVGGWERQKMAMVEDVVLGRRLKNAGVPQRFVIAPGAVRVHWAPGIAGLVRVMTKNLFAVMFFQPALIAALSIFVATFFLLPIVELFWRVTLLPGALCLVALVLTYRTMSRVTGLEVKNILLYPMGAVAFIYAMWRSMLTVLINGGVEWRGTHYSLRTLRTDNSLTM